jgi:hypothetical protein
MLLRLEAWSRRRSCPGVASTGSNIFLLSIDGLFCFFCCDFDDDSGGAPALSLLVQWWWRLWSLVWCKLVHYSSIKFDLKASLLRLDLWRLQSCKRLWVSNHCCYHY